MVHGLRLMNMDVDGLSINPCSNQKDSKRIRWHVGEDEIELLKWHAL